MHYLPRQIVNDDLELVHLFHCNSKAFPNFSANRKQFQECKYNREYKEYPDSPSIVLNNSLDSITSFQQILMHRRSINDFVGKTISQLLLAKLIYSAFGKNNTSQKKDFKSRVVPSAGALYPIELYLVCLKVEEIKPGLYHYNSKNDVLEFLGNEQLSMFPKVWVHPDTSKNASLVFILSTIFRRNVGKYGSRGYRFMLMESGIIAEHISLQATEEGLGSTIVCGFYDDLMNHWLGFDEREESVLCTVVCGR
ncbi:SagB/ThcOx family dehydrogenase [Halotia wernerae UHCC 0503]|nr:SagB/ThcOx family dehydrogenase [Halotia wernerae UHCC 0503]